MNGTELIKASEPIPCEQGRATISGIPPGVNRSLIVVGIDNSDGKITVSGKYAPIIIRPNETTGPIEMALTDFSPQNFNIQLGNQKVILHFDPIESADVYNLYWRTLNGNSGIIPNITEGHMHVRSYDQSDEGLEYLYSVAAENIGGQSKKSVEVGAIFQYMQDDQTLTPSLSLIDNGEYTSVIDMIQNMDCDGDATTDDAESFSEISGDLIITIPENAPGVTLKSYSIHYTPQAGYDTEDKPAMLPDLPSYGILVDQPVSSGSSVELGITVMTIGTKLEYAYRMALEHENPGRISGRYLICFTLNYTDDDGAIKSTSICKTISVGDYDNC